MNFDLTSIDYTQQQSIKAIYRRLKPGERIEVARFLLDQTNLDHYLSGHTGSAYSLGYLLPGARPQNFKTWTLFKLKPNENASYRTYVDPDRRHLYDYDTFTGLYTLKP